MFKQKKCKACKKKIKKNEETADLRLDTSEGILEMEICLSCADFFDKSAEVLSKGRTNE